MAVKPRISILCTIVGSLCIASLRAQPALEQSKDLEIAAQPLAAAVATFAKQTGLQIIYESGAVNGVIANRAPSGLTPQETLSRLLAGTGVTFEFLNDRTIRIYRSVPPPAPPNKITHGNEAQQSDRSAESGSEGAARQNGLFSRLAAFLGVCASVSGPSGVCAQDTDTTEADDAPTLEEVVVTGSRVITNGANSPTPVTVVTAESIQSVAPTTIFEGLLNMPAFAGSSTSSNGVAAGGAMQRSVGGLILRGMASPARTLVLLDGQRLPPTQGDGLVSVDMIPQVLLQRVEVVTGGVSAVYGSDGITGVVNFITDRNFNGVKINGQAGISNSYDDPSNRVSIAAGMPLFGGRGHIEGSYERYQDAGIMWRGDRQFTRERWTNQGAGTAASPYFLVPYATISSSTFGGKIVGPTSNPLLNQHFIDRGVLVPFQNGSLQGVIGNTQLGGDGAYYDGSTLKDRRERNQVFGRFDFDVTATLHYYLTASATHLYNRSHYQNNELNRVTLSTTNAFLAPAYQQAMAGFTTFTLSKIWPTDSVPPIGAEGRTQQWMANTGFEGELGDYKWTLSYVHGAARQENKQPNTLDNGRLAAALDAVINNGQIHCRVTVTHPGLYPGCVPLNVFGPNSESAAAIDYVVTEAIFKPTIDMDGVSGSIAGAPLDNWAGPVNMALSGEWRRIEYALSSNALPAIYDPLSCTGLQPFANLPPINCVPFNPATGEGTSKLATSVSNRPPVSQTVKEAAVEIDLPLLTEVPLAQDVNLNLAYRFAQYSISGNPIITEPNYTNSFDAKTWKLGLDWHFNDLLALRATRSRDFRAPTLVDLYEPGSVTVTARYQDTLTGVTPVALLQTGGNPNLDPEISDTATVGFVLKPTPSFNLSVDAYHINILNEIDAGGGYSPSAQRICQSSGGTAIQCTLAERPFPITNTTPANAVTKWIRSTLNLAQLETYGIDVEANFNSTLFGRAFSLRQLLTYAPHTLLVQSGAETQDSAGVAWAPTQGGAVWRATLFARYAVTDRFSIDWMTKWRSALHTSSYESEIVAPPDHIPAIAFSKMNLSYKFDQQSWGQLDLFLNVANLFNQQPRPAASLGAQGTPGRQGGHAPDDDVVGRYYTIGFRYRL